MFNKRSVFASLNVGFGYWLSVLALMLARYWHRCCSKFPEYVYIVVDIGVYISLDILIEVVINIEVNVGTQVSSDIGVDVAVVLVVVNIEVNVGNLG